MPLQVSNHLLQQKSAHTDTRSHSDAFARLLLFSVSRKAICFSISCCFLCLYLSLSVVPYAVNDVPLLSDRAYIVLEPLCGLLQRVMLDERVRQPLARGDDNFRVLTALTNVSCTSFTRHEVPLFWLTLVLLILSVYTIPIKSSCISLSLAHACPL